MYFCPGETLVELPSSLRFFFFSNPTKDLWKFAFPALCSSTALRTNTLLNLLLKTWITPEHECFPLLSLEKYQCHFVTSQRGEHPFRATVPSLHFVKNKSPLFIESCACFVSSDSIYCLCWSCSRRFAANIGRETQFAPNQFYLCSDRKQNTTATVALKSNQGLI